MAWRAWFTPEKCEGLTAKDCEILNRATRNAFPPPEEPAHLQLMEFRMAYKPGMSAKDLLVKLGYED